LHIAIGIDVNSVRVIEVIEWAAVEDIPSGYRGIGD
jgi:hypothetical protein